MDRLNEKRGVTFTIDPQQVLVLARAAGLSNSPSLFIIDEVVGSMNCCSLAANVKNVCRHSVVLLNNGAKFASDHIDGYLFQQSVGRIAKILLADGKHLKSKLDEFARLGYIEWSTGVIQRRT